MRRTCPFTKSQCETNDLRKERGEACVELYETLSGCRHRFSFGLTCQTLSSSALKTSAGSLYVRSGRFFSNHSLSSRGMSEKLLHASTSAFFDVGYSTCLFACSRAPFKALMVFPNYNWSAFDITFNRSTSQPLTVRIFRNRDLSVDMCCETQSPVLGHWQIFRSVDWPVARQSPGNCARSRTTNGNKACTVYSAYATPSQVVGRVAAIDEPRLETVITSSRVQRARMDVVEVTCPSLTVTMNVQRQFGQVASPS